MYFVQNYLCDMNSHTNKKQTFKIFRPDWRFQVFETGGLLSRHNYCCSSAGITWTLVAKGQQLVFKKKKKYSVFHNVVNAIGWLTSLSAPNTWPARPIRDLEVKREQKVKKKKALGRDRPLTMDIDSHRGFHWEKTEKTFDKQPRQVLRFASLRMNKSTLKSYVPVAFAFEEK